MIPFYTIGYEGSALEPFLATLQAYGIEQLLDVRRLPLSRKPGFSKKTLAANAAGFDIAYRHLVALGTPAEIRAIAKAERDYPAFFAAYGAYLATQEAALQAAAELIRARPSVLVCFERSPHTCHRLAIAEALQERDPSLQPIHLEVG